ncbi:MAG: leucine-rich repeat protein [Ruminococcus sp.]|nr:leucine-rich repeat protein [Ruminococcus sp.]
MGKIKGSVSAILSVLMAASVLTTAPVSAATVEASDAGANAAEAVQAELKIAEGSCGDKLTWTLGNNGVLEISGEGKMYDFDFEAKEGENSFNPWTLYRDQIKKVVVKDGVEYIGNFAFFGFAELEEAQIADSVKEIGENAFEGCDKLDKTTLPEAFTEPAKAEKTTKSSPVIIKEEEEAVGAAAEEAVGASVSISKCTIALSTTSCTYSYCERKPVVTVKNGSKTLENGTDYKLTYKNNINPGTATVTITGKGSYTGSVEKKFTVNKRNISTTDITLSSKHYTYSGNAKKPTVTATYNSHTLVKDTDYTVTYKNNTNVGTATVTITGTGKYFTGSVTKSFSIHRKS